MARHPSSDRARRPACLTLSLAAAAAVSSLFIAANAHAEPTFPGVLKDAGATCIVTCLTCHTDPAGGGDKLKMPFGTAFGAAVKVAESGNMALLDTFNNSDADGDKVMDLVEVKAGQDPTIAGSPSICTPSYGCGARLVPTPPSRERGTVVALALAAGALVLAGRRRSKQPPR